MNALFLLLAALFCLLAALILLWGNKRSEAQEIVMRRFRQDVAPVNTPAIGHKNSRRAVTDAALVALLVSGFKNYTKRSLAVVAAFGWMGWYASGPVAGLLAAVLCMALVRIWQLYRKGRIRLQATAQLPLFVDQLVRGLATGQSIEASMRLVAKHTAAPLGNILARVVKATDLGAGLAESLLHEAAASRIKELQIIALSVDIGNRFGSSPKEMLKSVMQMIHAQERVRRELHVMTGETRITALILLLTPVLILLYIVVMNPGYLDMLTTDAKGIILFRAAIVMQVFGAVLFWRMLKSV